MGELRFEGRVAIVTGAGRGLGREEALLLARRGAAVVVNDLGGETNGTGSSKDPANEVVAQITAEGGKAVASFANVATDDGAAAIVKAAIDAFGRLDILVNNAGITVAGPIEDYRTEDFERVVDVHLGGTFRMCRAAWPHMVRNNYGRIVNTSSSSIVGFGLMCGYTAAKGGIFGFTNGVAKEGKPHGILANTIFPGGGTRMIYASTTTGPERAFLEGLDPALVAPPVAYLAHESCTMTGQGISAVGKEVSRIFIGKTVGYLNPDLTLEDVAANIEQICSLDGYAVPGGVGSWK
jgi:NAD(P)-dependent dehydrogenase (short-subunit alcohol dehydrogenase family)